MKCLAFSWLMISVIAGAAIADTYVINPHGTGHFPSIQAAISASQDGDVIELTDGTYRGDGNRDINFQGKRITVRSQSGDPNACIIDCEGSLASSHQGFAFDSGEGPDSRVERLQVTNGFGN